MGACVEGARSCGPVAKEGGASGVEQLRLKGYEGSRSLKLTPWHAALHARCVQCEQPATGNHFQGLMRLRVVVEDGYVGIIMSLQVECVHHSLLAIRTALGLMSPPSLYCFACRCCRS